MVDRCVRKDSSRCGPRRITPERRAGGVGGAQILPMIIYQWVWILPVGVDFTSGSGLPVSLDMKTPWARLPAVSCNLHTTMA